MLLFCVFGYQAVIDSLYEINRSLLDINEKYIEILKDYNARCGHGISRVLVEMLKVNPQRNMLGFLVSANEGFSKINKYIDVMSSFPQSLKSVAFKVIEENPVRWLSSYSLSGAIAIADNSASFNSNCEVMRNTLMQIEKNRHLLDFQAWVYDDLKLNALKQAISPQDPLKYDPNKVKVREGDSFDIARTLLKEGRIAVLDMANFRSVGGGTLLGAHAQEEELCRRSTLYAALYSISKLGHGNESVYGVSGLPDGGAYIKGVRVFRAGRPGYEYLDRSFTVDVIVSAAQNVPSEGFNEALTVKRIEAQFVEAIWHGAEILVLGAFGCGAFGNDPKKIAELYKNAIAKYGHHFKRIVFAIYVAKMTDGSPIIKKGSHFKIGLKGQTIKVEYEENITERDQRNVDTFRKVLKMA